MNKRAIASLALGLAVVLGASGCAMISPQATTIPYSPAEGVNVADSSGPLKVRNALIVSDPTGDVGNFIAAVVNDTDTSETLIVGVAGQTQAVNVPARSTVSLGVDGAAPLLFEGLGAEVGGGVDVSFQSGDGTAVETAVPVLDGKLPYLSEFVPAA